MESYVWVFNCWEGWHPCCLKVNISAPSLPSQIVYNHMPFNLCYKIKGYHYKHKLLQGGTPHKYFLLLRSAFPNFSFYLSATLP